MIEGDKGRYFLRQDGDVLVLRTTSFVPEKGSILHSGIYNREFASLLTSFALAGMLYFLLAVSFGKKEVFYAVLIIVFAGSFPLFRRYVFKERYLETVINRSSGIAVITMSGIMLKKPEVMLIKDIDDIMVETTKTSIENPDAVAFVEKISAQHGTVIPGFGEETVFYSIKLKLHDGTCRVIHADSSMQDVIAVYDEIKEFLKI